MMTTRGRAIATLELMTELPNLVFDSYVSGRPARRQISSICSNSDGWPSTNDLLASLSASLRPDATGSIAWMMGRDLSESILVLRLRAEVATRAAREASSGKFLGASPKSSHIGWISPVVGSAVHKGASLSSIFRSRVCCEYGGYLTAGSIRALWYRTPRALVSDSKLNLPLYLPIPELPTPPKGISGNIGVIMQSSLHACPDSAASRMRSATLRSSANT